MALSPRLQKLDALLDYLVERLVAEMLEGTYVKTPRDTTPAASLNHQQDHEQHSNGHMALASGATL